jgi:hypothetical protein
VSGTPEFFVRTWKKYEITPLMDPNGEQKLFDFKQKVGKGMNYF